MRVLKQELYGTFIGDVTGTPSSLAGLTTDNLSEGTNNLYFTTARARSSVSGSTGLDYNSSTGQFTLDFSDLTDMTQAVVGTQDELVILDNGAERRKLISEITLSDFNNDSGFITGNQTITLSGDVSGSGTTSISVTVADDSHNHVISNVDNLQTELDNRPTHIETDDDITGRMDSGFYQTSSATTSEGWPETSNSWYHLLSTTHSNTSNYYSMQFAANYFSNDKLYFRSTNNSGTQAWQRIFHDGYHPNADAWTTSRTLTVNGDASGSVSINGSADATLTLTVADDSHNHVISNVDGLQTALDAKAALSGATFTGDVTFSGGANALTITNSDIRSAASSSWTGNPGANGKIQYHSNRWYIVADSSSNRIVQFRRDGSDKSYIDNNGKYIGDTDQLDGQHGSYYLDYDNFTNKPTIPSAANNGEVTLNAGNGLTGGAAFSVNQSMMNKFHLLWGLERELALQQIL